MFNERVQAFARYWSFTPQACRPYRARAKGKVERSVGYVKANALARPAFASWGALDRHLATWLATVVDHRALNADGTTPLSRFRADRERLTDPQGKPPFGSPRELEPHRDRRGGDRARYARLLIRVTAHRRQGAGDDHILDGEHLLQCPVGGGTSALRRSP